MKHKTNIRIINKYTGKESKALTYKLMKAVNNYENIQLPEKFRISVR